VLFLRKLTDRGYTHEHIAKLRPAVEIAEIPTQRVIQFNDNPLFWLLIIVPVMGVLWNLGADLIKQTEFWKGKQEVIAELSVFGVRVLLSPARSQEVKSTFVPLGILGLGAILVYLLIYYFISYQRFLSYWGRKAQYQEIQRFLQWAEHDIEEEQLNRRRRLCEEVPGPHGPAH